MNNLDFEFDTAPWEAFLDTLEPGSSFSAAQLLSLMEQEDEQTLEEALEECALRRIFPDVREIPKLYGTGDQALRLRTEEQWANTGLNPGQMEANDPLRIFLEEVAMTPAQGDEDILADRAASGDEGAMSKLLNLTLSRILELACAYTGRGVALMDLIQEGSLGMMQAVFQPREGSFRDVSDFYIRFYMAKTCILQAHAFGVGQNIRRELEDYRAVDERLLSELGRNATTGEIAEAMHISIDQAQTLADMVTIARKLKQALPEVPENEELPQEEDQAVEDTAYFQTRQRVNDMLSGLSEQEAKLISLRFGLEGGLPLSPEEAGRKLGLTPNEVVQMEAAALAKMRNT